MYKYLCIWRKVSFMLHSSFILQPLLALPYLCTIQSIFHYSHYKLIKQDGLATAFSITSLTELEWACRIQPEFVRENSEVFLFCLINLPWTKHSKR